MTANNAIRRAFDRAATTYDAHAGQQREILHRLLALARNYLNSPTPSLRGAEGDAAIHVPAGACLTMDRHGLWPRDDELNVLDGGCGTGYLLDCAPPEWNLYPLDLADGMCRRVAGRGAPVVQARLESIPFADASFDLVFSSLALQWVEQPENVFAEAFRLLKPGGVLAFSTYTDGTLKELQQAFATIDAHAHTLNFISRASLLSGLRKKGFEAIRMEAMTKNDHYANVAALCRHLRGLGAQEKREGKRRTIMTPRQLAGLVAAYPHKCGNIEASWEIGLFIAYKPQQDDRT